MGVWSKVMVYNGVSLVAELERVMGVRHVLIRV